MQNGETLRQNASALNRLVCGTRIFPFSWPRRTYNNGMKSLRRLPVLLALILCACQPASPALITVLDGQNISLLPATTRIPADLFIRAGLILGPQDQALFNGLPVPLDQPLPESSSAILQLRRALTLTVMDPMAPASSKPQPGPSARRSTRRATPSTPATASIRPLKPR